jgi:hypothetical protein
MISVPIHRVSMSGCGYAFERRKTEKRQIPALCKFYGSWYSIPVYPESLTAVALIHSGSQLIE